MCPLITYQSQVVPFKWISLFFLHWLCTVASQSEVRSGKQNILNRFYQSGHNAELDLILTLARGKEKKHKKALLFIQ